MQLDDVRSKEIKEQYQINYRLVPYLSHNIENIRKMSTKNTEIGKSGLCQLQIFSSQTLYLH